MKKKKITFGMILNRIMLLVLLFLTFFPILVMINMSLKPSVMITNDFFGLPRGIYWTNFVKAFDFVIRPIGNSLFVCVISCWNFNCSFTFRICFWKDEI